MKRVMTAFACISFLLVACNKSNDNSASSANSWNFAGQSYKAATVVYMNAGAQANLSAAASGGTTTSADGLVFFVYDIANCKWSNSYY